MGDTILDMLGRKVNLAGRVPCRAKDSVPIRPEDLARRGDTALFWLGGGGFLINSRGTVLLFDPVLEMDRDTMRAETGHNMLMPYPIGARDIPRADMIFYTHPDLDHVGPDTSRVFAERQVPRVAPQRVVDLLYTHGVRREDATACRAGDVFPVGSCRVEVIPADHPWQLIDPAVHGKPLGKDDACGFVIRTPDGGILLPGDTRLLESHLGIPGIDVVLVDTAKCAFHLNVEGAIILSNAYPHARLIPYHYGMFDEPAIPAQENGDPADVFCAVKNAEERAAILAPGERFLLGGREGETHG